MLVLGLQGSPRKQGNTRHMLSLFLNQAEKAGFQTKTIDALKINCNSCIGCENCEKTGFCIFKDVMAEEIFPLFRRADIIVLSTPVYFYSVSGQIKPIIDRTQTLWSRIYRLNLKDPGNRFRKGILLSAGATKGKNLFDGIRLTAKYFFDAAGANFSDDLCYKMLDKPGEIKEVPTLERDMTDLCMRVFSPFKNRKKILFACRENAGRSQMAAAFARNLAGDRFDVISGGSAPVKEINATAMEAMEEKGIDIAFNKPCSIEDAIGNNPPDVIVTMGCKEECPYIPGCRKLDWDLPDPAGKPLSTVRTIRDAIEKKVTEFVKEK